MPQLQQIRTGLDPRRMALVEGMQGMGNALGQGLMTYGQQKYRESRDAAEDLREQDRDLATEQYRKDQLALDQQRNDDLAAREADQYLLDQQRNNDIKKYYEEKNRIDQQKADDAFIKNLGVLASVNPQAAQRIGGIRCGPERYKSEIAPQVEAYALKADEDEFAENIQTGKARATGYIKELLKNAPRDNHGNPLQDPTTFARGKYFAYRDGLARQIAGDDEKKLIKAYRELDNAAMDMGVLGPNELQDDAGYTAEIRKRTGRPSPMAIGAGRSPAELIPNLGMPSAQSALPDYPSPAMQRAMDALRANPDNPGAVETTGLTPPEIEAVYNWYMSMIRNPQ